MAPQTYSYLGGYAGPQIDVNLYPDAAMSGIQQGNAQPSVVSGIIQGAEQGVKTGIGIVQGIQGIQATAQKLSSAAATAQVEDSPEGIQARKDILASQATQEKAQATVAAATTQTDILKKTAVDQDTAAKATQDLHDQQAKDFLNRILGNPAASPDMIAQALQNPAAMGAIQRSDTQYGQSLISQVQGRTYPQIVGNLTKTVDAVETQKQRIAIQNTIAKDQAEYTQRRAHEGTDATNALRGQSADLAKIIDDPQYDPTALTLVRSDAITGITNPVTGKMQIKSAAEQGTMSQTAPSHTFMYNGQPVANTPPVTPEEAKKLSNDLLTHKSYRTALGIPKNNQSTSQAVNINPGPIQNGLAAQMPQAAPSGDINQNILDRAKQRQAAASKVVGDSTYNQMVIDGRASVAKLNPTAVPRNYLNTDQATPTPINTPALTAPVVAPTPADPQNHVASALGVTKKDISLEFPTKALDPTSFEVVNNIPELANAPAALKGLIYVESGGNPLATSYDKNGKPIAKGLTQLTPPAANESGVTDPYDTTQSSQGGLNYLINKYNEVGKSLNRAYTDSGLPPTTPDPRIVFAAYNGGMKAITQAINAGNTDWEGIKRYIEDNHLKSSAAIKENFSYPDKVLNASLAFVKGGNVSDDLYLGSLFSNGILNVNAA